MPEDIHFHARKSHSKGTSVDLEIWKGMHILGVWALPPEQAWNLAAELIENIPEAPPETDAQ